MCTIDAAGMTLKEVFTEQDFDEDAHYEPIKKEKEQRLKQWTVNLNVMGSYLPLTS